MSIYTIRDRQRMEAVERSSDCAAQRLDLLNVLAEATATICGTPLAMVNLVETEWMHTVGTAGLQPTEIRRSEGFCGSLVDGVSPTLVVEDAAQDNRFWHLEAVQDHGIRFYAGAQLTTIDGMVLGAVCVLADDARVFSMAARSVLATIAKLVTILIDPDRRPAPTTPEGRLLRADASDRAAMLGLIEAWAVHPDRRDTFGPDRLERLFILTRTA